MNSEKLPNEYKKYFDTQIFFIFIFRGKAVEVKASNRFEECKISWEKDSISEEDRECFIEEVKNYLRERASSCAYVLLPEGYDQRPVLISEEEYQEIKSGHASLIRDAMILRNGILEYLTEDEEGNLVWKYSHLTNMYKGFHYIFSEKEYANEVVNINDVEV
jgi:hypothetical protein